MTHPVILEACRNHSITPEQFFGKGNLRSFMECRKEAARVLRERGNSWSVIARILKRNHCTARYWLDEKTRERRKAYMRKYWHEDYKFREARA